MSLAWESVSQDVKRTDCHDQFENWSRNDRSQEVQQKAGRDDVGIVPYGSVGALAQGGGTTPRRDGA